MNINDREGTVHTIDDIDGSSSSINDIDGSVVSISDINTNSLVILNDTRYLLNDLNCDLNGYV